MLIPLLLFVALILAASLLGLTVSGHFPRARAGSALADGFGRIVLFGSMAMVVGCLPLGITSALRFVPWYAAVIGGGFALLVAPQALCWFPDRFVDGRGALAAFTCGSAMCALLLAWLAAGAR